LITSKKIISISIKILIGVLSFLVIYWRLKSELTPEKLPLLKTTFTNPSALITLFFCILLMPLNWGIEALKWQRITKPVEPISFLAANQSVYSGVFAGNLAPGRATEFLAKILFFSSEKRAAISVLHFVNGMFQLSITIILGLIALFYKTQDFSGEYLWIKYVGSIGGIILLIVFAWCFIKIDYLIQLIYKRILKQQQATSEPYHFSSSAIIFLLSFSVVRYFIFALQFALLLFIIKVPIGWEVFINIAIYFFITTTIPMISFLEAAIRVAVALVVFKNLNVSSSHLAIVSILLWLINIVIPSIIGYCILITKKIEISFLKKRPS
jgi:hypothetical protein